MAKRVLGDSAYGPRLRMIHLKDLLASGGDVNVPLGKGIARIPDVMKELKRVNYTGLWRLNMSMRAVSKKTFASKLSTPEGSYNYGANALTIASAADIRN